jgi:hypothetical protein
MKPKKALLIILIFLLAGVSYMGCKKIDLVRIAHVRTGAVSSISQNSATVTATIVDLGEGGVKDHGFCWAPSSVSNVPTKSNSISSIGKTSLIGDYSSVISGLISNTEYSIRPYIEDDNGIHYGDVKAFLTPTSGGTGFWLKYNDGFNHTGIGVTDGSNFDYAIRFPTQALTNYNGYRISKIRFYPTAAAQFHVEVFEGVNPPALVYYEAVSNVTLNAWTEYSPTSVYYINSTKELWVGIWVTNYFAGTYPAGVDDGPAIAGAGDMISFNDGVTWVSLYTSNSALNYNWNLEVFVTNQKGEQVQMVNTPQKPTKEISKSNGNGSIERVVSEEVKK